MKPTSSWYLLHHPMHFQGWKKNQHYFEGWYFKIVDPVHHVALAFIPGISIVNNKESHAFIQVLDGVHGNAEYHEFDIDAFTPTPGEMSFSLGDNSFSENGIVLNLPNVKAQLTFDSWSPLPKKFLRPGIMGWYSYTPFMQCYHGLGSMNHFVSGNLTKNGQEYELVDAKGYVEKDWGESFPKAWIWSQCNSFPDHPDLSVFSSVAHIPWLMSSFIGFIAAVHFEGNIEVFATYNSSKRITQIEEKHVLMTFERKGLKLELEIMQDEAYELKSPINGEMLGKVNESILATTKLILSKHGKVVVEAEGNYSGLEVAGPVDILLT